MKLTRKIEITPGTQSLIFDLGGTSCAMAIAIIQNCDVKWAEGAGLNSKQTWNIKSLNDLNNALYAGLSTFSCRLPSPDGICARVTIDFLADILCLTCAPDSAKGVLADISGTSLDRCQPVRRPRRARVRLQEHALA